MLFRSRKALYFALVMAGFGTEILSLFTEHGTNATLPGGVYSLAPLQIYLKAGREAVESVHRASGIDGMLEDLGDRFLANGGIPYVVTQKGQVNEGLGELDTIDLPSFQSLPLPSSDQWR